METTPGLLEVPEFRVNWKKDLQTSAYTSTQWDNKILIGGSNWNRKEVPYSKSIAANSPGLLHLCDQNGETEYIMELPSMIYCCLPLPSKLVFVGCKSTRKTGSLLDKRGFVYESFNDPEGQGIYNAEYNHPKNQIITTTRAGKLITYNADNLAKQQEWQLSAPNTRLWSLKMNTREQNVYSGDYDGVLHKVNLNSGETAALDLKNYYPEHPNNPLITQGFGPSIWGLESLANGNLVLGTRWNQLIIVNPELEILASYQAPESITSLQKINEEFILVGSRLGTIYIFDLINGTFQKILENPPVTQKENAAWSMSKNGDQFLITLADGTVFNLSLIHN